jgi:hypothetical protein
LTLGRLGFAGFRAIRPAQALKRLAATPTRDTEAPAGHTGHRRGHEITRVAASNNTPARHFEWIEAKGTGYVVFNAALIAAEPPTVVAAWAAINKGLATAETSVAGLIGGNRLALLAIL